MQYAMSTLNKSCRVLDWLCTEVHPTYFDPKTMSMVDATTVLRSPPLNVQIEERLPHVLCCLLAACSDSGAADSGTDILEILDHLIETFGVLNLVRPLLQCNRDVCHISLLEARHGCLCVPLLPVCVLQKDRNAIAPKQIKTSNGTAL